MIERPEEQQVSMRGQIFFLLVGLIPIGMLFQFWTRSGTGLNLTLFGYMGMLVVSLLMAVNYYMFYRTYKPRSALVPPGPVQAIAVAALLFGLGIFNMLATPHGLGLTLSPGPRIETARLVPTYAKMLVSSPGELKLPPTKQLDLKRQSWLRAFPYFQGGLWGALGYALAFGIAGALFGLLRREVLDPRDEHAGSGMMGALVRAGVGLFYGSAMGFMAGATIVALLRTLVPTINQATPDEFLRWIYVFGAGSNPNTAFAYAFTTACMFAGATALFLGRRDFTSGVSDPKAPELTRPVEVHIPEVPPPPEMNFDMGRVRAETEQIVKGFSAELNRMFKGPEWEYERYDLPPIGRGGRAAEVEATNLISAREVEDTDEYSALGPLSSVYVQITAELGKLELSAYDWLTLSEGAILELPKSPDGVIGISINGKTAGKGKALTVNGYKAVKVTQLSPRVRAQIEQQKREHAGA